MNARVTPITQLEIDQRVYDLYDEYCHGKIDRREFLARSAALVVGGLAMAQALLPRYAQDNLFDSTAFKRRFAEFEVTTYRQGLERICSEAGRGMA